MGLKVSVEKMKEKEGCVVVSPVGSIDSDTYAELEKALHPIMNPSTMAIVLNMGGVTYLSSIGFGVIFKAKQTVEKHGGTLVISNIQPNVKKIFDAVKAVPESLFATMQAADEYLDAYIANMHKKGTEGK
jgi:anti-anti-sigma factor